MRLRRFKNWLTGRRRKKCLATLIHVRNVQRHNRIANVKRRLQGGYTTSDISGVLRNYYNHNQQVPWYWNDESS